MSPKPATDTCRVCGEPLEVGEGWWRCRHPSHPSGAHMPDQGLGDLFSYAGQPWGLLADRKGWGIVRGWRELERGNWQS